MDQEIKTNYIEQPPINQTFKYDDSDNVFILNENGLIKKLEEAMAIPTPVLVMSPPILKAP